MYNLPPDLIAYLNNRGVAPIAHIMERVNTSIYQQAWMSTDELGIPDQWSQEWRHYTIALTKSHVKIRDNEDEFIWTPAVHGAYTPKDGYPIIHDSHNLNTLEIWWRMIWKLKASPRTRLFMWNMIMDKTPTGTNIIKISFQVPSWCVLCR